MKGITGVRRFLALRILLAMALASAPAIVRASTTFNFFPGAGPYTRVGSGCYHQGTLIDGKLSTSTIDACYDGKVGFMDGSEEAAQHTPEVTGVAMFTSNALAEPVDVGGTAQIIAYYADEAGLQQLPGRNMRYHMDELTGTGEVRHIGSGVAIENVTATEYVNVTYPGSRNASNFEVPAFTVGAGSRVRLLLGMNNQNAAAAYLMYGSPRYPDSGITFGMGMDTAPDPFSFTSQADVARSTPITSAPVVISGIDTAAPVSVTGGSYSIGCTGAFTSADGSIASGQTVCVRHTSSGAFDTETTTTLTVGGVVGAFSSTTAARDITPEPFSFADQDGVTPGASVTSNAVTVAGVNDAPPVTVSGGTYSIGCTDGFTSEEGTVADGQTICVRHTASSEFGALTTTQLTIGGVSASFNSTTAAAGASDTTPDAFAFADQDNVERNAEVTSIAATIGGIDTAAPVSVTGGYYSIGCTATFADEPGSINNGQTVCVRHLSSSDYATPTVTTLRIGGVAATFTSTTLAGPVHQTSGGGGGGGGGVPLLTLLTLAAAALRRRRD